MEGAEEKKDPAVPETLKKKKAKEFHKAEDQGPEKEVCLKDAWKARRKLIYEKAKHYHKEYRQI